MLSFKDTIKGFFGNYEYDTLQKKEFIVIEVESVNDLSVEDCFLKYPLSYIQKNNNVDSEIFIMSDIFIKNDNTIFEVKDYIRKQDNITCPPFSKLGEVYLINNKSFNISEEINDQLIKRIHYLKGNVVKYDINHALIKIKELQVRYPDDFIIESLEEDYTELKITGTKYELL